MQLWTNACVWICSSFGLSLMMYTALLHTSFSPCIVSVSELCIGVHPIRPVPWLNRHLDSVNAF